MAKELIEGLQENLWAGLRNTLNTDRMTLGVALLVNFALFVLLLWVLPGDLTAALIALILSALLNRMIYLSLCNGKAEVISTIQALAKIYEDNGLEEYFPGSKEQNFKKRYNLWLVLVPSLMIFAVVMAASIQLLPNFVPS